MRGLRIWGKRKRMMRGFDFIPFLRWRCIEQVLLVLGWTTELGCGKKKRWGGQSYID
jgi:hypothetical protein